MVEYTVNVFGMKLKGHSVWIFAIAPVFLAIAYAFCAVSLYAFDTLLGIPEFTWTNVFWWMVVIATFQLVFKGGSD